jgi:hypothetical protein
MYNIDFTEYDRTFSKNAVILKKCSFRDNVTIRLYYDASFDKLYDLNIIKYYFKNKVQLFVVFILPWLIKIYKEGNSQQRKTLQGG